MADFVESAKNFVNAAVSRTSWEAQKQLRVRSKQSEIDQLLKQRQQLLDELSQVAMTLYQNGALTDSQLSRLCASIQELDADVRNREGQMQDVKNEPYPADKFAPGPTMNYSPPGTGTPPPSQGYPPPAGGYASPGQGYTPPPASGPAPGQSAQQPCPTCGKPVRPNALYCRNCGTRLR